MASGGRGPFEDDALRGDGDGLRDGLRLLLGVLPCCGRAASAVGEKAFAFAERLEERRGAILARGAAAQNPLEHGRVCVELCWVPRWYQLRSRSNRRAALDVEG